MEKLNLDLHIQYLKLPGIRKSVIRYFISDLRKRYKPSYMYIIDLVSHSEKEIRELTTIFDEDFERIKTVLNKEYGVHFGMTKAEIAAYREK